MRTECEQSGPLHWRDRPALMAENDRLRAEVGERRNTERQWLEIVNAAWAEVPEPLRVESSAVNDPRHPLVMAVERMRAEVEALRGLRPETPERPPHSNDSRYQHPALKRYGLRWNGPGEPVSVPMEDGYWTPFHAALAEVEALRADAGRYRYLREHGDAGCTEKDGYGGQQLRMGEDLDARVDAHINAAMKETKE